MKRKLRNLLLVIVVGLFSITALGQSSVKSLILNATEDTYIVTDLASEDDPQGFRQQNYGALEFLKTWYAWGVVQDERLLSIDLVKFDLTRLKDLEIESASLQLFSRQANLTQAARLVDVHLVQGGWLEADVTYDSRPPWDPVPVATAAVYGAGGWYSWNVTGSTIAAMRSGELSLAIALRSATQQNEEQVLFVSKEAVDKAPRLLLTYNSQPSSGLSGVDWWWWAIIGGIVVVLVAGAFVVGSLRQSDSDPSIPS